MRMPEPDMGHYTSEVLNYGYVYTNLGDIEIQEDMAKDYIVVFTSRRKKDYHPIKLPSCYSKRHRERTRLATLFIKVFLSEAKKYELEKKINKKELKLDIKLINDWKAEDIDALTGAHLVGDKAITASNFDLQKIFDYFVRNNLTPLYPEDRSVGRVKESIYRFFADFLDLDYIEKQEEIIQIVLSDANIQHFINVISLSKDEYLKEVAKRMPELEFVEEWEIPESIKFGSDYLQEEKAKSIMEPFYSRNHWQTERAFIELLDKSKKIEWWFKNYDRDATFFAVPYESNGGTNPFYVDFIVKFEDGKIGLFDTKSGFTQQLAGDKVEGIYKYIQNENKKINKLFGGIVTNTDSRKFTGRWIYFDRSKEELIENNFDNWVVLEL